MTTQALEPPPDAIVRLPCRPLRHPHMPRTGWQRFAMAFMLQLEVQRVGPLTITPTAPWADQRLSIFLPYPCTAFWQDGLLSRVPYPFAHGRASFPPSFGALARALELASTVCAGAAGEACANLTPPSGFAAGRALQRWSQALVLCGSVCSASALLPPSMSIFD